MPDGLPYSATESADIIWTGTTQAYQAARAAGIAITRTLRHGVHQRYVEQAHQRVGVPFVPPSAL